MTSNLGAWALRFTHSTSFCQFSHSSWKVRGSWVLTVLIKTAESSHSKSSKNAWLGEVHLRIDHFRYCLHKVGWNRIRPIISYLSCVPCKIILQYNYIVKEYLWLLSKMSEKICYKNDLWLPRRTQLYVRSVLLLFALVQKDPTMLTPHFNAHANRNLCSEPYGSSHSGK